MDEEGPAPNSQVSAAERGAVASPHRVVLWRAMARRPALAIARPVCPRRWSTCGAFPGWRGHRGASRCEGQAQEGDGYFPAIPPLQPKRRRLQRRYGGGQFSASPGSVLVPRTVLLRRLVEVPRRVTKPSAVNVARLGTPGDGDVPTRQKAERAPPRLPHGTSTCRGNNTRGETRAWRSLAPFMLPRRHQARQRCWGALPWRTIP